MIRIPVGADVNVRNAFMDVQERLAELDGKPSGSAALALEIAALREEIAVLKREPLIQDYRNVMGASGGAHSIGLTPDTPDAAGTGKFLREDATWAAPPAQDHGGLSGLADDDHTQYVLAAGDTMTGSLVTTSAASDNNEQVTIEGTNADSGASGLKFKKLSASPAASDYLGHIRFAGYDSGNNLTNYARVSGVAKTLTDGAEEGSLQLGVATAGAVANTVVISPSLVDVTGAVTLSGTLTANGAVAGNIPRKLHVNTTPVGNVGAGTDDLITYTLPGGTLATDGSYLHCVMSGISTNNAAVKTGAVYFGAATSAVISNTTTTVYWFAEMWVVRTSATTQMVHVRGNSNGGPVYNQWVAGTETLANDIVIKMTGSSTGATNNDIVQKFLLVEFFP